MNTQEKTVFINELIDNVKAHVLEKVDKYPDEWDGVELRWLIRDYFDLAIFSGGKKQKRLKDYKNECLVNNLV